MAESDAIPQHLLPDTATRDAQGCLCIGGRAIPELATLFGTPLYVFDVATIRNAGMAFRRGLAAYPGTTSLVYAAKAFASLGLLHLIAKQGLGIDCVSGGELAFACTAGVPAERLVFHGNNKSESELLLAVQLRVGRIVVDHHEELELLAALAQRFDRRIRILLRLNPGVEPHDTHAYRRTGQLDSKFGLPIETGDAERAVARCLELPQLELLGYHMHIGSQLFDLAPYREAIARLFTFAARMRERYGVVPHEVSPGGGFGVPYTREDPVLDLEEATRTLVHWVARAAEEAHLPYPHLVLEPGRSLVARAGIAVYRVGAVKRIPGLRTYVAVDGGMADNIRPALYGARYMAVTARREKRPVELVTIVGKYCESGDVLVRDCELPRPQRGDLIVLLVAGAYGLALASNYNLACRPAVIAVDQGSVVVWQRRETIEDLLQREIRPAIQASEIEFSAFS